MSSRPAFLGGAAALALLLLAPASSTQGTAFCFGDGSGTACPCGNFGFPGGGCSNSSFPGAILSDTGTASVTSDSLLLRCTLLPFDPNGRAVLFQGVQQENGGAGAMVGAGLRCIGNTIRRLGSKSLATGLAEFGPAVGDQALSLRGQIPAAGLTMHYQVWYRDVLAGCTQPQFNFSNGLSITWVP